MLLGEAPRLLTGQTIVFVRSKLTLSSHSKGIRMSAKAPSTSLEL